MIFESEDEWNFRGKCINYSKIRVGFEKKKTGILAHPFRLTGIAHVIIALAFLVVGGVTSHTITITI